MSRISNCTDSAQGEPECRICFEPESLPTLNLISPCQCRGSLKYVHETCIKQWINRALKNGEARAVSLALTRNQIACEICHQLIIFSWVKQYKCKKWGEIWAIMQKTPAKSAVWFMIFFLVLAFFLYTLSEVVSLLATSPQITSQKGILILFAVLFISFLVFLCLLVYFAILKLSSFTLIVGTVYRQTPLTLVVDTHSHHVSVERTGQISRAQLWQGEQREYFWHTQ